MPLKKLGVPAGNVGNIGNGAIATPSAPVVANEPTPAVPAPKTAPKAAKTSTPLSKEGYWERKEGRDIEKDKRIRRSGVWQAALQSMAGLQFNQGGTLETYLDLVDKIADRGLGYVNRD